MKCACRLTLGFVLFIFFTGCSTDGETGSSVTNHESADTGSVDIGSADMGSADMGSVDMEQVAPDSRATSPQCEHPRGRQALSAMVDACLTESADGDCPNYANNSGCGPIGAWDTSRVEDMTALFEGRETFNQDIGDWDVSLVGSMERMFKNAKAFNGDIGRWDTREVSNMYMMFERAEAFNQDIGAWNVGNVEDMRKMFRLAFAFNQEIGDWDVSRVDAMDQMFQVARDFNGKIQGWDVSNVRTMNEMFRSSGMTQDLSCWDLSNVAHANDFGHPFCELEIDWPTTHSIDCVANGECIRTSCTEDGVCARWNCDEGVEDERCAGSVTIESIQRSDVAEGTPVKVTDAVVTGAWQNADGFGFWIQQGTGPYSGIGVFSGRVAQDDRPGVGERVTINAVVQEYYGATQLAGDLTITRLDRSGTVTPRVSTVTMAEALDEAYEGVLVHISDAEVAELTHDCRVDNEFCDDEGLWTLSSPSTGADRLIVSDRLYGGGDWAASIGTVPVMGILSYRFDRRRIMPRSSLDFQHRCGDGVLLVGVEACDDGNAITEGCDYGQAECTVCGADCSRQAGNPRFCGDGIVDPEEVCDDGNDVDGDGCDTDCVGTICANGVDSGPFECAIDITFIAIPGGSFQMGSNDFDITMPVHEVAVPDFEMSQSEVTIGQYRVCVDAGVCPVPTDNFSLAPADRENHPMSWVSWHHAHTFAEFVGARLPTEAEWEFAARGGGQNIQYPWGDEAPDCTRGNFRDCRGNTTRVCSFPDGNTIHGLCDMAGNVWEWVEDDGHPSYVGAPNNGSARIDNPRPPSRVWRGSTFYDADVGLIKSANSREPDGDATTMVDDGGFRLVRSIP